MITKFSPSQILNSESEKEIIGLSTTSTSKLLVSWHPESDVTVKVNVSLSDGVWGGGFGKFEI